MHGKSVDAVEIFRIFSQCLRGLKGDKEVGGNYLDLSFLITLFPAHRKHSSHSYSSLTFLGVNNRHLYLLLHCPESKVFCLSSKIL